MSQPVPPLIGRPWPRCLIQADLRQLPVMDTDVLVLGGGAAGLTAALEAAKAGRVFVACKGLVRESASDRAQGGIAAAWSGADSFEAHAADTMYAGCGLCHHQVVRFVVNRAPEEIRFLESLGAHFDKHNSRLDLGREGGHCAHRIIHAGGDATGAEIMRTLIAATIENQHIFLRENCFAIDLLTAGSRVVGVMLHHADRGLIVVKARVVILATGGYAGLYRDHTHPPGSTGDGLAMAVRAGAALRDMEMVQFHPTVTHDMQGRPFLLSEAVRGEGAVLRDADGARFMPDYDERADLAPRDVVCRAIHDRLRRSGSADVYLDVRPIDPARFATRFPAIAHYLCLNNIDPFRQLIPVRPSAHYTIGGIATDLDARTNLEGLLACGEVASTGLHGANRLASNSLMECLVLGRQAGATAAKDLSGLAWRELEPDWNMTAAPVGDEGGLRRLRAQLGEVVQIGVGNERDETSLQFALKHLHRHEEAVLHHRFCQVADWETQGLWILALCTSLAALWRRESRGAHFRTDYPATDDARWRVHSRIVPSPNGILITTEGVPSSVMPLIPTPRDLRRENHHRTVPN